MSELQDALDDWISDCKNAGRAAHTTAVYAESARLFLAWSGAVVPADVTRASIRG